MQNDEEILKTDALGRVRTTTQRREALLEEFERSGLPATKFAAMVGVNYQTFARGCSGGGAPRVLMTR